MLSLRQALIDIVLEHKVYQVTACTFSVNRKMNTSSEIFKSYFAVRERVEFSFFLVPIKALA